MNELSSVELCAGAGGEALGLEQAGFAHEALVDIDSDCCETLRLNRPAWNIMESDLSRFDGRPWKGIDLLAGGLPCPPFSIAGKQLGKRDERNLFPEAIRLVDEISPRAVMIENVRGLLGRNFDGYREWIDGQFKKLGFATGWKLLNASDFGVAQLRPRVVLVAVRKDFSNLFSWPEERETATPCVGDVLYDLMKSGGWQGARSWKRKANDIGPTIVGGSRKHGGPDLGPTRAKQAWAKLGVDGMGVCEEPPGPEFGEDRLPRLTVRMVARLQGFPDEWVFFGRRTTAYRQVGNAFPPPVARAVAERLAECLTGHITARAATG